MKVYTHDSTARSYLDSRLVLARSAADLCIVGPEWSAEGFHVLISVFLPRTNRPRPHVSVVDVCPRPEEGYNNRSSRPGGGGIRG